MSIVTADDCKRVEIPDAKPGQSFAYQYNEDGSFTFTPIDAERKEPFPKGSLVKEVEEWNREWTGVKVVVPEPEGLD